MSPEPLLGGPTQVDYAGAACKMRGKHERNHKFVVALPRAQAFDRRRQFGRGTTRNHPEPPRNHPKSAAEPPRNHPGTTAEPIRNPARPNPIGTCGASICLNWHWLVTGSASIFASSAGVVLRQPSFRPRTLRAARNLLTADLMVPAGMRGRRMSFAISL